MLQWNEQNRAVGDSHEFHVFYDPGSTQDPDLPWILVIREVGEDGVHTHVVNESYPTAAAAKEAAEQWKGPPLK
jgi:hypothetical protein